jgi:dTDP-4-dehydrorhamnose reductase
VSILVIGGNGQLGTHLRDELPQAEFWDRHVVDLSDTATLDAKLQAVRADAFIIAAAYTAVDKAETERDLAWRINAEAPAVVARAAARLDVPVIFISTDYVFDGTKAAGYVETDATGPLNEYGRSKLGGERAVAAAASKHWILRTSWVFSEHGNNFPKTMLRLAREREQLRIVDDQRGQPTYAGDLARAIRALLEESKSGPVIPWGLYHVGSGPAVSWKEFAATAIGRAVERGLVPRIPSITGIASSEYPTAARRPANSVLLTQAAPGAYVSAPFDWSRGLDRVIDLAAIGPGQPSNDSARQL